ncbi:MAG: beta-lactamase family protein [Candidatus Aminicenantes bacterium]|nr:beta-lactamase family protein [Candidatus Aminicenantes bacterium]
MVSRIILLSTVLLGPVLGLGQSIPGTVDDARMKAVLEPIREKHKIPALAAALVTGQGLEAAGAVGVRKAGTDIPVTIEDLWHLGSDTKAMTAAMIGALVERGILKWDAAPADLFPDLPESASAAMKKATLLHLLAHRAGLPGNLPWGLIRRTETIRGQRLAAIKAAGGLKIAVDLPAPFLYSNLGFVIAGAMAEKAVDASWEDLMRSYLFEPLGMTGAGFGGTGTPGQIDQPWPHFENGKPTETNGPDTDNPPVIGPAGTIHCRLSDWAKFIADQLRGARGEPALLKAETYRRLHTPPFSGPYALGWASVDLDWAGGRTLTHDGSNSMNYCSAHVVPENNYAVLVVTNQGGEAARSACGEASREIVRIFRNVK